MCCFYLFFFFKQKTAYEMRISDWSSDVCSSDLPTRLAQARQPSPPGRTSTSTRPRRASSRATSPSPSSRRTPTRWRPLSTRSRSTTRRRPSSASSATMPAPTSRPQPPSAWRSQPPQRPSVTGEGKTRRNSYVKKYEADVRLDWQEHAACLGSAPEFDYDQQTPPRVQAANPRPRKTPANAEKRSGGGERGENGER